MFHPAAGDAVLHATLWQEAPAADEGTTSSSTGSSGGSANPWLPREVVLPCGGDLGVLQLLVTFVGLWHAAMRAQLLSHDLPAHR
jgi:hypothetical protein